MKTIINKCGGKKTGCAVEFDLPYGFAPKHISDSKPKPQSQAGTNPKPSK